MAEITRIVDQLDRAFKGPAWHGPAVLETLAEVTPAQAAARPLPKAHAIWDLAEHVAAWKGIVAHRVTQGAALKVTPEMDWPPIAGNDATAWVATRERLEGAHASLRAAIAAFPEDQLDVVRPGTDGTWYLLFHGIIQHDLYHAGQIALLKRAFA